MGSSQPFEEVTVSADGITVVKRFEEDEFPVPAIAFEFRSARDEPVTVRLRDVVPEGIAVEDLGFHPEYGSEYWTVDEGGISFERELEAGAEYTTVYGIRATETEDIEQFLVEPTIEAVDPPLPDSTGDTDEHAESPEADVVPGNQDAVKEAISGEGAVPGLEDEEEDEGEDEGEEAGPEVDAEALDLDEPTAEAAGEEETSGAVEETDAAAGDDSEPDAEAAAAAETSDVAEADSDEGASDDEQGEEPEPAIKEVATGEAAAQATEGSLLATLADEIRSNEVDEEDLELLRDAVEATDSVDGSAEARIRQLQRDVADLRAYTDALDEFLDENGTAQQVLEDARDRIDDFETRLGEFGETVERVEAEADDATSTARDAEQRVGTLREEVDGVHEDVEDVEDGIDDLEEGLDDVQEDVEDVEEDIDDVEENIDDVEADVEAVEEDVEGVQAEVGEVQTDVDDLAAGVDEVRGDVEELQVDMESASGSIEDLEDRAATFEEDLEELKAVVHEGDLEGRIEEMESTLEDLQEWQTQIKETFGGG
ncbi:MAG: hypothetical protein V5A13_08285 [Haloarculaceae archaeon]